MSADSGDPTPPLANLAAAPTAGDLPLISAVDVPSSPLVRIGGLFGIVGCVLGLLALLAGCAGVTQALVVAPACTAMGAFGIVLTLAGAFFQKARLGEDTHVLQALFAGLMSLIGGLLEMAVWYRWPIFK